MMPQIQWYPGHMVKAKRILRENLKLVDLVFELVDARLPQSSRNPDFEEILRTRPRIIILNKADLADKEVTDCWLRYFRGFVAAAIPVNAITGQGLSALEQQAKSVVREKMQNLAARGWVDRPIRAMVVGIPNVGKSSLINRLAGRAAAKTGDKPGVTRAKQWVKIGNQLDLLDTPGILWPKFEDQRVGFRLAAAGAISDDVFDRREVAMFLLAYLMAEYPQTLMERYKLTDLPANPYALLLAVGRKRGLLVSGGQVDDEKAAALVLHEFRAGKLGAISLEKPE